jgi:hypothetical protein
VTSFPAGVRLYLDWLSEQPEPVSGSGA